MRRPDRLAIAVAITSAIATVAACLALLVSITSQASELSTAARNSCELLRFVVLAATPPGRAPAAAKFLNSTPLRDCHAYADNPVSVRALERRLEHKR